jgi:hypothetical protein
MAKTVTNCVDRVHVEFDLDRYDAAYAATSQLAALLASVTGPGFEPFSQLVPDLQEDLLSLASDLADKVKDAISDGVRNA